MQFFYIFKIRKSQPVFENVDFSKTLYLGNRKESHDIFITFSLNGVDSEIPCKTAQFGTHPALGIKIYPVAKRGPNGNLR